MSRPVRTAALCLGLLLLAPPVVWACGELAAAEPDCPMARSLGGSPCHGGGEVSMDCCNVRPSEPVPASLFGSVQLVTARADVGSPLAISAPTPVAVPLPVVPAPDGPGRYVLLSSYLL